MVVVKKNYKLFFFKENSKKFVIDFFENADLMPKLLSYPNLNQFFKVTAYFFRVVQLKQSFVRRNVDFFLLDGFFKRKKLLDLDYLAFTKDLIFKSYISKIVVLRKVIINKVVLSLK